MNSEEKAKSKVVFNKLRKIAYENVYEFKVNDDFFEFKCFVFKECNLLNEKEGGVDLSWSEIQRLTLNISRWCWDNMFKNIKDKDRTKEELALKKRQKMVEEIAFERQINSMLGVPDLKNFI